MADRFLGTFFSFATNMLWFCCKTEQKQIAMNELSVCRIVHASEGAQLVSGNHMT